MKMTLSTNHAAQLLNEDENANWTYAGALALVEYLEEMEEESGEEIEFNVVAIRCDYSQYDSLQDWADEYFSNAWEKLGLDSDDCDSDEFDEKIREYIQDNGQLIEFIGGIVVSSF